MLSCGILLTAALFAVYVYLDRREQAARILADDQHKAVARETELRESGVTLQVRALDGKVVRVRASNRDTVDKLKSLVEAELDVAATEQVLMCAATRLWFESVVGDLINEGVIDPDVPIHVAAVDEARLRAEQSQHLREKQARDTQNLPVLAVA